MLSRVNPFSGVSAGTTQATSGVVSYANSNGVSFGLAGNTLTGTVATNYQSQGAYLTTAALSQDSSKYAFTGFTSTTAGGAVVAGTHDTAGLKLAVPAYLTTAMGSNAATISAVNVSAGATSANLSAVTFSNSNGVSFGITNSIVTATVATNYQSQGAYLTTAMQSNAATISNVNVSAGTTSNNLSAVVFSNSNGMSFGLSGSTVTASYTVPSVPAQTNQTLSLAATSNTAGNTSGMSVDARSLTIAGYGAASVGYSTSAGGSTVVVSVPAVVAQTVQTQNFAAQSYGSAAGGATTGTMALVSSGTAFIYAGNNVTISQNNQSVTLSVPNAISAAGVSNVGNTAGNTGTTAGTLVFSGQANITLSQSTNASGATIGISGGAGGAATGISGIADNAGTQTAGTVSFANSNGVTFGLSTGANTATMTASVATSYLASNASTNYVQANAAFNGTNVSGTVASNAISVSVVAPATISMFEMPPVGTSSTSVMANLSLYFQPFLLPCAGSFCRLDDLMKFAAQSSSAYSTTTALAGGVTVSNQIANGYTRSYGLWSLGTGTNSTRIESLFSSTWRVGYTAGYTVNDGALTQTVINGASVEIVSNIGSNGAYTMSTVGSSSTVTGAATTSIGNSFSSGFMSGLRNVQMGFATSLTAGNYWLGMVHSSSGGTTGVNSQALTMQQVYFLTENTPPHVLGVSQTVGSNQPLGAGAYSTTTGAIPQYVGLTEIIPAGNQRLRFCLANQTI